MAYSTEADIKKRISEMELAELTSDAASGDAEIDTEKITEAIGKADALIDGYIAKRYTVPLTDPPDIVKDASVAIAVWFLRGRRQNGIDESTADQKDIYEKYFEKVSKEVINLPGVEEACEAAAGTSSVSGNTRAFTRDTMIDL